MLYSLSFVLDITFVVDDVVANVVFEFVFVFDYELIVECVSFLIPL